MYGHGYGFFGMGWMWIVWLIIIVVLVFVVVRALNQRGGRDLGSQTPEQILKQRYARGEIDRDEYQRRLEDLRR